ncbi:MAG: FHA domain-containing protein [Planctomycetes bacterium]|nr:FHA domain-containing protein [Planctomycetota bacterium]
MITIVVSLRGRVITTRTFSQERLRIGRAPDNEVRIDNAALSRQHAVIERSGRVYTLIDTSQRNGVYVNGERVARRNLNHGDTIALGKFVLSIDLSHRMAASLPARRLCDLGRTVEVAAAVGGAPRTAGGFAVGHLRLPDGRPTLVLDRDATLVGSGAGCDLRPPGLLVPRRLALIVRGHGGFSLLNLGRPGAVLLEALPLRGRAWLRDGDRVSFAGLATRFQVGLPLPTLPPAVSA